MENPYKNSHLQSPWLLQLQNGRAWRSGAEGNSCVSSSVPFFHSWSWLRAPLCWNAVGCRAQAGAPQAEERPSLCAAHLPAQIILGPIPWSRHSRIFLVSSLFSYPKMLLKPPKGLYWSYSMIPTKTKTEEMLKLKNPQVFYKLPQWHYGVKKPFESSLGHCEKKMKFKSKYHITNRFDPVLSWQVSRGSRGTIWGLLPQKIHQVPVLVRSFFFFFFLKTESHYKAPKSWLGQNSLYRPGWHQIHRNLPLSASWVLG